MKIILSKIRTFSRWLAILLGFDTLVLWTCRKKSSPPAGAIFCLHGLGDLLLAGQAIDGLHKYYRQQGLTSVLFVPEWLAGFARRYFEVDRVEGIIVKNFRNQLDYRAVVLRSIAGRFHIAVQPTYNRLMMIEDALMRATGARHRIGSGGHAPFIRPLERWFGDRFYTQLIRQRQGPMNELARYAEFMAGMGLTVPAEPWRLAEPGRAGCPLTLPAAAFMVVCPHSSDPRRDWPLEQFLRAAQEIAAEHMLAIVVVGMAAAHRPLPWPDTGLSAGEVVDLRGQFPTEDLPAVLAGAELILANDSGAYHLGVSLDRPTLAVGGSGMPHRYYPYPPNTGERARVLYQPVPCAGCTWRCRHPGSTRRTYWCLSLIAWPEAVAAARELLRPAGVAA